MKHGCVQSHIKWPFWDSGPPPICICSASLCSQATLMFPPPCLECHCGFGFFSSKSRMLRDSQISTLSSHQHLRITAVPLAQHPGHIPHRHQAVSTALAILKGCIQNRSTPGGTLVMLLCLQFIRFSVSSINQCPASAHTLGSGENMQGTDITLGAGVKRQAGFKTRL